MDQPSTESIDAVLHKLADNELIPILLALRYTITYREIGQLMALPAAGVASSIRSGLLRIYHELNALTVQPDLDLAE